MNRIPLAVTLLSTVLCLGAPAAQACGEGMFNSGKGLPFQSYLAPHTGTILILANAPRDEDQRFYEGLERAGHSLVVVSDETSLQQKLREQRFDLVIGALREVDKVVETSEDSEWIPRLLPVVARSERNSSELRSRFDLFVLDGASLGQYLSVINRALSAR